MPTAGRSYYAAVNAGKRVRRMNLKDAAVRAESLRLVEAADVLLGVQLARVMAKLGLGYETLAKTIPDSSTARSPATAASGRLPSPRGTTRTISPLRNPHRQNGGAARSWIFRSRTTSGRCSR